MKYFKDAAWLKEHMNDENVFILDIRFDLFDPATKGFEKYKQSHIKGAYYLDVDKDITENKGEHGGRRGTPDKEVLGKKLANLGITMDSVLICYDDGVYSAPRAFWQLTYMGYTNVYVLDGGFSNWQKLGYPVSTEMPLPRGLGIGSYKGEENGEMFACKNCVKKAIADPSSIIIDSRAHNRYTGEYEPLYSKKGHVPTAKNIHYLSNMKDGNSDEFIGTKQQWEENFKEALNYDNIILFCGSAIEACINYMFLLELGKQAKVYIGSMSDWVTYDDLETRAGEE